MSTPEHFTPVPLERAYRLLNHGPTVLVSSAHGGQSNVMAAAWSCPLDFKPPKVTVVIDKTTATGALVEDSGLFVLNVPARTLAAQTVGVGTDSSKDVPDKLSRHGAQVFAVPDTAVPLVQGCVAWLACRLVPEPHNQQAYDLFIGEVTAAWADERVFSDGRWHFERAPDELRTLHYVAGGSFTPSGNPSGRRNSWARGRYSPTIRTVCITPHGLARYQVPDHSRCGGPRLRIGQAQ